MRRALLFVALLALTGLFGDRAGLPLCALAQQNDPHAGKVPHCDNFVTTTEEQRCDCNKATTCPEPGATLPEEQKCKSWCYHGCGCIGPCET